MKSFLLQNSVSYCVKEQKPCVGWVNRYLKDCLCNLRDEFSFGFGLISLFCWAIAEIPQIVTNFRTKSSHGISLLFLLTWVAGSLNLPNPIQSFFPSVSQLSLKTNIDESMFFVFCRDIFNLVGCLLEPVTVSFQFSHLLYIKIQSL